MYKYTDTQVRGYRNLPSIQTIIDGINLDREIEGYRTLHVSGREMVNRDISTSAYKLRTVRGKSQASRNYMSSGGAVFLGSSLSSRNIKIHYQLHAKDNIEFRQMFEKLNYLVQKEQITIRFTDDMPFHYIGTFTEADVIEGKSNIVKSSFGYECTDPFKYSEDRFYEFTTSGKYMIETNFPTIITKMTITLQGMGTKFILRNVSTGQSIILDTIDSAFVAGDVFELYPREQEIYHKGILKPRMMDLLSDFEDFSLAYEDELNTSIPAKVVFSYQEPRL